MNVYFEKLTLANVVPAWLSLIRGRQVYYFEAGHLFRKLPILGPLVLKSFRLPQYKVSESIGLAFEIDEVSLWAAEQLYQPINEQNRLGLTLWNYMFPSPRLHLFIKKTLAFQAQTLVREYLVLLQQVREGKSPLVLVVLDNALNRMLIPMLLARYPDSRIQVKGLSRFPWHYPNHIGGLVFLLLEVFSRLMLHILQGGISLRPDIQHHKLSKEILWGIGTGRRNDDFLIDGELLRPEDIIFFYRRTSSSRMPRAELLQVAIDNAAAKGYQCVNFERITVPLVTLWRVITPKYVLFPMIMAALTLAKQVIQPSAALFNQMALKFLTFTMGWEFFLASHSLTLNLSQDDTVPSHIAETIVLNVHGAQNGGFQWADATQWRSVALSYCAYNLYFAWGTLPERFWQANWGVDRVVHTGYLWGHHFKASLDNREELRKALTGNGHHPRFVVSLLDETPSPNFYVTERMLVDFYRVGVKLLDLRPDTIVLVKPKRITWMMSVPEVTQLIGPYVDSGRMVIRDWMSTDVQEVVAVSDIVVSMVMGSPYLEAMCCGIASFNYAPSKNHSSAIYDRAYGKVVFDEVGDLVAAIDRALDHSEEDPWGSLAELKDEIDPYRDLQGIERMRRYIHDMGDFTPQVGVVGLPAVDGTNVE